MERENCGFFYILICIAIYSLDFYEFLISLCIYIPEKYKIVLLKAFTEIPWMTITQRIKLNCNGKLVEYKKIIHVKKINQMSFFSLKKISAILFKIQ